jgi:hypothetical protein
LTGALGGAAGLGGAAAAGFGGAAVGGLAGTPGEIPPGLAGAETLAAPGGVSPPACAGPLGGTAGLGVPCGLAPPPSAADVCAGVFAPSAASGGPFFSSAIDLR